MPVVRAFASASASASTSYVCEICGKGFTRGHDLRRHVRGSHDRSLRFGCTVCPRTMAQKSNMVRHMATQHYAFEEPLVIDLRSESTASSSSSSSRSSSVTSTDLQSDVPVWPTTESIQSLDALLFDTITSTPVLLPSVPVAVPSQSQLGSYMALPTSTLGYTYPVPDSYPVDPFDAFMPYLTGTSNILPPVFDPSDIFSDVASTSSGLRTPESLPDFNAFAF